MRGGFSLGVIHIAVEVENMAADDVAQGKHVYDEQQGSKHRTLRRGIWSLQRTSTVFGSRVGLEPVEWRSDRIHAVVEDAEAVKSSREVE